MTSRSATGRHVQRDHSGAGRTLLVAALAVVATGLVTLAIWAATKLLGVPFADLSREPVTVAGIPRYTGWYAHLVIVVWMVPVGGALVGALVLHRLGRRAGARLLLLGGALTTAMVADDLFLLHESVYPKLGLPAEVVYLGYATATAAYAWWFRDRMGDDVLLLGAAFAMWTTSIGFDVIMDEVAPLVLEDSAKAAGTVLWSLFLVRRAAGELLAAVRDERRSDSASRLPAAQGDEQFLLDGGELRRGDHPRVPRPR